MKLIERVYNASKKTPPLGGDELKPLKMARQRRAFQRTTAKAVGIYKLLSLRDRSEKEIRDYFKIRNFKLKMKGRDLILQSEIEEVLENLKDKGLINDEKFANAWVQSRSRKYGPNRIKQELAQKGIRNFEFHITDEKGVADRLLQRKMKSWKDLEILEFQKKATEFLIRRGFEFGVAQETVAKFLKKV